MHSFISSVLTFFLAPLNWILILLVAAYLFRKTSLKKVCIVGAIGVFILFSNQWILDWYARSWQPLPLVIPTGTIYSCAIVAGGFASPAQDGQGYFNSSADRFIQAVKLYKLGKARHLLVSGGNGKTDLRSFREAEWVKGELVTMGVPDSVILVEDRSNNTAENAANAKEILLANNLQPPYLLISSAHHLPRATLLFKKAGLPTVAFPCNYEAGRGINSLSAILPRFGVLSGWDFYLKETAGYWWYR